MTSLIGTDTPLPHNVERFWLGGASQVPGDGHLRGGRAGKPKTCWTRALAESVYGDCCVREPIDERRCWAVRVIAADGLSVVTLYTAAFAADRVVA